MFILRLWRAYIVSHKTLTLKDNFMSSYCYVCIELNAHSLVKSLLQLKEINKPHWFMPHLFESQPCEALFRQVRSFTSTYSTVANCTVKQILERITKIQLQNDITSTIGGIFKFTRLNSIKVNAKIIELPSIEEIKAEIERAKKDALKDAKLLGIVKKNAKNIDFSCKIQYADKCVSKKSKQKTGYYQDRSKRFRIQLDRVLLKNFSERFIVREIDETSGFVEIFHDEYTGKRIVVKKTSLVWLLRNEPVRLSSDRLERVKASLQSKKSNNIAAKKKQKIPATTYIKKPIGKNRKKIHFIAVGRKSK